MGYFLFSRSSSFWSSWSLFKLLQIFQTVNKACRMRIYWLVFHPVYQKCRHSSSKTNLVLVIFKMPFSIVFKSLIFYPTHQLATRFFLKELLRSFKSSLKTNHPQAVAGGIIKDPLEDQRPIWKGNQMKINLEVLQKKPKIHNIGKSIFWFHYIKWNKILN